MKTEISIVVEWKKSRTWGSNPTATVRAFRGELIHRTTGTASGCGYDKESAAVANALNANNVVQTLMLSKAKDIERKHERDEWYGIKPLGSGRWFDGGVGMSCFTRFFREIGATVREVHTDSSDVYNITIGR
jgi:hypothetical protein